MAGQTGSASVAVQPRSGDSASALAETLELLKQAVGASTVAIFQWKAREAPFLDWIKVASTAIDARAAEAGFSRVYHALASSGQLSYSARPDAGALDRAEILGWQRAEPGSCSLKIELLEKHGLCHQMRALVALSPDRYAWVGALETREAGSFDEPARLALERCLPAISERLRSLLPFHHAETRATLYDAMLDLVEAPGFILATDGRVLHANRAGAQLIEHQPDLRTLLSSAAGSLDGKPRAHCPQSLGPLELSWVDEASPYLLAMAKGSVSPPMPRTPLSPRELEVAKLISDGYSTLNVAARLGIGEETVRTLLRRVYAKWRISGRVELTRAFLSRPAP